MRRTGEHGPKKPPNPMSIVAEVIRPLREASIKACMHQSMERPRLYLFFFWKKAENAFRLAREPKVLLKEI
jgi:hypothetical protein